ncbi:MAG: hypothetical protein ACK4VV_12080 [Pseudomonas sp.]
MHPSEQFISLAKSHGRAELLSQWQHRVLHAIFARDAQGKVAPVVVEEDQRVLLFASHDTDELDQLFSEDMLQERGVERVFISATLQQLALFCNSQGVLLNWAGQRLIIDADMLRFFAYSTIQHTKEMGKTLIESQLLSFTTDAKPTDPSHYCDGQHWTLTALNPAHPHAGDYPDKWMVSGLKDLLLMPEELNAQVFHRDDLKPRLQALYDRWATRPPTLPEAATEAEIAASEATAAQAVATASGPASPDHSVPASKETKARPVAAAPPTPEPLKGGPRWPLYVLFFAVLGAVIFMVFSL